LQDKNRDPAGLIRVTAPVVVAQRQISPLLPEFRRLHPAIELELVASARTLNLVEEGFDLSIRLMRADQVGRTGRGSCAKQARRLRIGRLSRPLRCAGKARSREQ
jgi:DNA-binding transcriptional LysR family regulator